MLYKRSTNALAKKYYSPGKEVLRPGKEVILQKKGSPD